MLRNHSFQDAHLTNGCLRIIFLLSSLLLLASLAACAAKKTPQAEQSYSVYQTPSEILNFKDALFQSNDEIIGEAALRELSEAQKNHFLKFFRAAKHRDTPPFQRVAAYLTWIVDEFDYSENTYTASQTLNNASGNCLSLAILTSALAEMVDVPISFELMDSNPLFDLGENYFVTSNHLRAVLKESRSGLYGEQGTGIWMRRVVRIDFFASSGLRYVAWVNRNHSSSLYYSNLAVELMQKSQLDQAYAYAKKALELYQDNWSALNSIGILHRRRGDSDTAEAIYKYGAEFADKKSMFLKNYVLLLEDQSRAVEAAQIKQQLLAVQEDEQQGDPWHWIHAGRVAHEEADYQQAIRHYDKALLIAPDLHRVHMYSAIAHFQVGNHKRSKYHLDAAIKHAPQGSARYRYERKLAALTKTQLVN